MGDVPYNGVNADAASDRLTNVSPPDVDLLGGAAVSSATSASTANLLDFDAPPAPVPASTPSASHNLLGDLFDGPTPTATAPTTSMPLFADFDRVEPQCAAAPLALPNDFGLLDLGEPSRSAHSSGASSAAARPGAPASDPLADLLGGSSSGYNDLSAPLAAEPAAQRKAQPAVCRGGELRGLRVFCLHAHPHLAWGAYSVPQTRLPACSVPAAKPIARSQ